MTTINEWRNDPELISQLGAPFRYINAEVDARWYEAYMSSRSNAIRCAVTTDDSDDILGLVSLTDIDYLNQSAILHIMVGSETSRGHGTGTYAVKAMLYHAFYNMNLQRVELTVLESNLRARHVYEKCGFQYEGRKRSAVYKNGCFADMLQYSILKSEFMEAQQNTDALGQSGGGIGKTYTEMNCLHFVFFRHTAKLSKTA